MSRSRTLATLATVSAAAALAGVAAPATGAPAHRGTASSIAASGNRNSFRQLNLVSDMAGKARITDPNLVNAWGLAATSTSPIWVANNGTNTSTLYAGATMAGDPPSQVPLVVSIPGGVPSGTIDNTTMSFKLSSHGKSGPAIFIFASESGNIVGWNSTGNATKAVVVAHRPDAIYKGLSMDTIRGRKYLLAANFQAGRIDIFNRRFAPVSMPGRFASVNVPTGYAPFNVAAMRDRVYVTYAKQDADREDDVAGHGHGFLNVFTRRGRFLRTLVSRHQLNSPWGLAIAPRGFGPYAGKLLVGNFGNGRIHVVSRRHGTVIATLDRPSGRPITIDGLWGLLPGNGTAGGTSDLWFSAGPGDEAHGLLGILRPWMG